ncbi:hypothetical protein DMA11_14190 [Marinilabiliaceae bacterium JC017]|nr:hypothetical protein DMA11_14190 [Marinilabiliaceae bacterium JC017]
MKINVKWPDGKRFAFTVFDDTDYSTVDNSPKIYKFLYDLGMITTKSVWPIKGEHVPLVGGSTCENPEYLKWVYRLQEQGFEIALHNATYHTSNRDQVIKGLEIFKEYFGDYPKVHVNHTGCDDSIYWGDERLRGINRMFYNVLTCFRNSGKFMGTLESSDLFWGDKCKEYIKYVRNFVYSDINTLKACPYMPYFDERKPFVNNWFASSEGANCHTFCQTISEINQDRLEEESGCCIMYTHFGSPDFYEYGRLNGNFKKLMERLSLKNGWFVPVSVLLDYIRKERGNYSISDKEHSRLERRWLINKIFGTRGTT